jgi:D-3-phosphoglycerate dehydrogenase / 2-oxoglutarate reductase
MSRILLTHSPATLANYYGDRALAGLQSLGEVVLNQTETPLEGNALIDAARDCDLIVSYRQSAAPAALFEQLPNLVAFLRCAIDIRNVDVAAASKAGVLVTQASAGFVTSVTELVIGFMIDLSRGVSRHATAFHSNVVPQAVMGQELRGSTIGVIGYGAIGRELVRVAHALGMHVLINDPYVKAIEQTPMDALIAQSDYVVPLAVANAETENLMGEREFQMMKPGAFFINVSRGNLVDEAALTRALDSGRIAGAALDVGRAPDQMPSPALAARPDVIATPHTAGLTLPAIEHQSMETVAQAAEILKGRVPKGAVNGQAWTRRGLLPSHP